MTTNPKWLLDAIHFFQKHNCFVQYQDLSDDALATLLQKQAKESYWGELKEDHNEYFPKMPFYKDLMLLSLDSNRMWAVPSAENYFKNPDDYYFEENTLHYKPHYYQQAFVELSKLSLGKINIKTIHAQSSPGSQFISLDIELNGDKKQIRFIPDMGILDLAFLPILNEWILETGYQYTFIMDNYSTTFTCFLSKEEKSAFEKERGWVFQDNAYYWTKLQEEASNLNDYKKAVEYSKKAVDLSPSLANAATYIGCLKDLCDFGATTPSHIEKCKLLCKKYLEQYISEKDEWFYQHLQSLYEEM